MGEGETDFDEAHAEGWRKGRIAGLKEAATICRAFYGPDGIPEKFAAAIEGAIGAAIKTPTPPRPQD